MADTEEYWQEIERWKELFITRMEDPKRLLVPMCVEEQLFLHLVISAELNTDNWDTLDDGTRQSMAETYAYVVLHYVFPISLPPVAPIVLVSLRQSLVTVLRYVMGVFERTNVEWMDVGKDFMLQKENIHMYMLEERDHDFTTKRLRLYEWMALLKEEVNLLQAQIDKSVFTL